MIITISFPVRNPYASGTESAMKISPVALAVQRLVRFAPLPLAVSYGTSIRFHSSMDKDSDTLLSLLSPRRLFGSIQILESLLL